MIKRFRNLSIGHSIFLLTTVIVGLIMLISSVFTNNLIFDRTDQLVRNTSKEINKQVVMNYENYLSNVIDISNSLQNYIFELSREDKQTELQSFFNFTKNIERNVENIALFDETGKMVVSSTTMGISPFVDQRTWFTQAISLSDIHHFSSSHIEDFIIDSSTEVFSVSKSVQFVDHGVIRQGVLLIDLDTSNLKALAAQTNLGASGHIIITDQNSELIYSSNTECSVVVCESIDIIDTIVLGEKLVKLNGLNMFVNVNTIKYTRWKIATFINVDEITNSKTDSLKQTVMIFLLTIVAIAASSAMFSLRIASPMKKLKEHIEEIEQGDFETMVHVTGQKEVVVLAEAFNAMSQRIKELMKKVLTEQAEKRKTHFIALQNQINPHFLYNTLDSIVALSEKRRNRDIEKAIIALSRFFRMSISNEMSTVSLRDEVEHVRNYLLIQQIRYQHSFVFTIDIDESCLDNYVLKLSLQPLVENAIIHGINPTESFTKISIKAYQKDDHTIVEVYNEGYGINQERIDEIHRTIKGEKESTSMGLKNVYQRLKLIYGESADLTIESVMDEYTKATMIIPLKEESII